MIYTSGKDLLTRPQLHNIPIPERDDTGPDWQGVEHGVLADSIVNYVKKIGFKIYKEIWYTNPNQSALYGAVDIDASGTDFILDIGTPAMYSIGVRHDNKGRYAISLALGARVMVCSNGIFSGDFVLKNKHYNSVDIDQMVEEGVEEWLANTAQLDLLVRRMRGRDINDAEASHFIVHAGEKAPGNYMTWAHLHNVAQLWYRPQHKQFLGRNLWSLYNCFTEVAREMSPPRQMRMFKGLKEATDIFLDEGSLN